MKWLKNMAKRVNWKEFGVGGALLALGAALVVTCVAPAVKVDADLTDEPLDEDEDLEIDDSDFEL